MKENKAAREGAAKKEKNAPNETAEGSLNDVKLSKLKKLDSLKAAKINPYPYSFDRNSDSETLRRKFSRLSAESPRQNDKFSIAGRVMMVRSFGKLNFLLLRDGFGDLQIAFKSPETSENAMELLKYLDAGDFIGVKGYMFRTHKGELTLMVEDAELLTKSIAPLPEKWHGLKDVETRYRQRYVDLIINPEVKKVFEMRSKIIRLVRKFLDERGFLEVETPLMQPVYGGANARPFVTYANAWDTHLYMSISPELYLKRLVVGGYEKVYTICKNFRNEDVDKTHNPEFTMIEAYAAYVDYNYWMEMTEDLYVYIAKELFGSTKFDYCGTEIDVKKPWKRYTMEQALKELAGKDVEKMPDAQIQKLLAENEIEVEGGYNRGLAINELFGRLCEPKLIQPVFIIDPPRETCPLAKQHRKNPKLIERFEPFIMGWEVANAYSELNDPAIQKEEFEKQEESRKKKSLEHIHPADFDYVNALEYGMPPTGGWGMGIDRLVMLFTGSATIKDVIFFPQMRPEHAGTGVKDLKELSGAGKKK